MKHSRVEWITAHNSFSKNTKKAHEKQWNEAEWNLFQNERILRESRPNSKEKYLDVFQKLELEWNRKWNLNKVAT